MQTQPSTWTGIAGVLHLDGAPSFDVSVAAMARAIAHRGLASAPVTASGAVQLAAAHSSADLLVVIDGQTAPAKVARLYRQHGLGFVDHLDGGFAVALWDGRERRLVLARDCAGVRPLFVARPRPGLLIFGSEVKALLAHPECPRAVDWLGTLARDALAFRRAPPTSYFKGIDTIAPGTLVIAGRDVETRRFWSLARVDDASDRRSDAELIAGYAETLRAAVVTATADAAPPALLLSGGVDSIAIAALGRASRPTTFTVLSRSTFGNGDAGLARDAAAHLALVHHAVVFRRGDAGRTIDWWRRLVWTTETPHCRAQHYLKSELARAAAALVPDTRVLLHGEGSDELIGADPANWNDASDELSYDDYLAQLAVQQRDAWVSEGSLAVEKYFAARVFNEDFLGGARADLHPLERRALYCLDALADDVLWRDDRLAAAHGLQARAPFLDRRVLDYVAGIPRRAYQSLFWKKRILRDGLAAELPERFRWQPKVPFYAGADVRFTNRLLLDLLVADGDALVHEALGDPDRHPVLAPGFITGLLADAVRDPSANAVHDLLVFVNLGLLEGMTRAPDAPPMPPVTALATWRDDEVEALLAEPGDALDVGRALRLGAGVELARPCADEAVLWIVVDDQVRYVVDEGAWRAVLGRVDGVRPLAALLAEAGVTLAAIRKHLDEALEFQVVAFV